MPAGTGVLAPTKRSRKRWLIVWTLLGVIAGAIALVYAPNAYQARTVVVVVPQRVPERIVPPWDTLSVHQRLTNISQVILSRTRLERLIQEFDLYRLERQRLVMEDVVQRMREDVDVEIARPRNDAEDVSSFSVSFTSGDPRTAMRVTERLASLFVLENLEDRELRAGQTQQFLKGQLEEARRRLFESDLVLRKIRQRDPERAVAPVTADHEVLLQNYKRLLELLEAADLAVNLERRQISEQFKVIDGARLPERPLRPSAFPYLALGGLGGVAVAVLLSMTASVWRRRRARREALPAPA
jgi:uncharacterized protein involved in exopolysaccharide biosynthesis